MPKSHITRTAITNYVYGMLRLKEGPNQPGSIFSTLFIYFIQFFSLINYSLGGPHYIRPRIFYFHNPILRLTFTTPFRDSHSQPHFATHIRDSYSRPTFRDSHSRLAFHDSTRDSLSRLTFATPLATPIRDSHLRLHSRLTFTTPHRAPNRHLLFFRNFLSCDSTTDRRTVLTPQHHLPSIPTLTLVKTFWNLLPGLASIPSYYPPSCPPPLVALCLLTCPLAHYLLQRPPPSPARTSANIPTFIAPSAPPSIPPVWEHVIAVLMELPPTTTAEGQNLRSWVTYHSFTSLEDFLMWELDTLQYDAITVCLPSRDTTQPNSLISLKPNSIRHLIMLRKYIHHLVQDSHLSVSSDATDCEITTSSPSPSPSVTASDPRAAPSNPSFSTTQLMNFKRGIKIDISAYPTFKDEKYCESFYRSVLVTARAHDCEEILQPSFRPRGDADSIELFRLKNDFMYSVFNK